MHPTESSGPCVEGAGRGSGEDAGVVRKCCVGEIGRDGGEGAGRAEGRAGGKVCVCVCVCVLSSRAKCSVDVGQAYSCFIFVLQSPSHARTCTPSKPSLSSSTSSNIPGNAFSNAVRMSVRERETLCE